MLTILRIKKAISFILYYAGVLDIIKRIKLKNKAFILMYHMVINPKCNDSYYIQPGMYVAKDTFEMHVSFLKKKFKIISLEELIEKIKKNKDISGCCVITFDDGWVDNYENALPILKKCNVPATIFLATGYIDTNKWFWIEELSYCLSKVIDAGSEVVSMPNNIQRIIINPELSMSDKIDYVIEEFKLLAPKKRVVLINKLYSLFPFKNKDKLLMDWAQVKEMYNIALISFGAHTVNHEILTQISAANIQKEVSSSQKHIEGVLDNDASLFSYPNGNFNKETVEIVIKNNFKGAVTTRRGYVEHKTHLMKMPRIGMHNDVSNTKYLFFARILLGKF